MSKASDRKERYRGRWNPPLSVSAEFWKRVKKGDEDWNCWEWTGSTDKTKMGHGRIKVRGRTIQAHRLSYRLHNKYPIEPEVVMHICDNPSCVNPLHLRGGTQSENRMDCVRKGRHSFGEANGSSKLTEEQAVAIYQSDKPASSLAREYGIDHKTATQIKRGEKWKNAIKKLGAEEAS